MRISAASSGLSLSTFVLILVFAAFVGGALGSYAGVVASRGFAASLGGRSHCDACGRTLAWYELVPFVSYISLRGRCRTCAARIGWAPLLWELGSGALAVAVAVAVLSALG